MNPLETRSTPNGLWQYIPQSIATADQALQRRLELTPAQMQMSPWKEFRWLTEADLGILLCLGLLGAAALWISRRRSKPWRTQAQLVALYVACLGVSDLVSSLLKVVIGRLKPHVNFFNSSSPYSPALACPSNHAFNAAFGFALLHIAFGDDSLRQERLFFGVFFLWVMLIGASRVLFGQHHPLDVALGWMLGVALARGIAPAYRALSLRTLRK
ncbi:MAG: phosphatase PAP2 family protein [Bdellovibrionales bacterium]|nr:phosphatase PAP2 family protein [Bdellovibrionales bacterium]